MHLIEGFVRNPVKVAVGVILIALFGSIALFRMPMQLTPEVQIPTLTIETMWPGASPQEIESEIIQEQEEQLQSVEGVRKMTSESMDSMGRITLEFPVAADMGEALLLVNTRLQQVREYPENADEPVISTSNSSDRFIAWFILGPRTPSQRELGAFQDRNPDLAQELDPIRRAHNAGLMMHRLRQAARKNPKLVELLPPDDDVTLMRRFAEDMIEARFERVGGVANSNVVGGREEEMQVVVDSQRLAARNLTINNVREALRTQNKDTSAGDFWEGKRRYVVRTLGQFRSPDQVANSIIARRQGAPVYVRDVAEVKLGHKKPDGTVRRFGTSVVAINVQRETGANVLNVMEGLKVQMAALNEGILAQRKLELTQVYDETEYINSSVDLVKDNIVEGGILTFICLMIFLRSFRSTFVVFLAICVSIVGMFLLMSLMGRSLNVLSLAGIAFAVGMLVDNFIVVLENIYRHHQNGDTPLDATVRGTKDVWGAVVASTVANLAVFIPILFVQDEAGQLFRDIALATSSALAISLLVSLILVPTAAARIIGGGRKENEGLSDPTAGHFHSNGSHDLAAAHDAATQPAKSGSSIYDKALDLGRLMMRPLDIFGSHFVNLVVGINAQLQRSVVLQVVTVATFLAVSLGVSYILLPKVEYLPTGNRNLVFGILLPPPGYNLDHLERIGEQIEREMQPYWDADPGQADVAKLKYPIIGDFFYVARGRQLFMGVRAHDPMQAARLEGLLREVGGKIPGTFMVAKQASLFETGLSGGRTIDIEITGPDIEKLARIGTNIFMQVDKVVPGAQKIPKPSLDLSSPEVHATPRWHQSADMGINATDLGYAVDALVDGAYATDYFIGGDKIDLSIIGQVQDASQTQDLRSLAISTPTGELVTLAGVADVKLASGPEQINHRERQRAITIEVTPPAEVPLEDAIESIDREIIAPLEAGDELEGGLYQINKSGTADKLRSTWQALRWNLLLALIITYLVMAALFESWLYPLVIIASVPLGAVGGFIGLALLNLFVLQPLDVLTMLGFIILVGTVVNNPILIVEQALVHIREDGMFPREAVLESVRTRIRPIFMTALIGLFGLLPLVISPGAGSELYRGLGSVMLGGLMVSTVFTLVLVPTLFTLFLEFKQALSGMIFGHGTEKPRMQPVHAELPPAPHIEKAEPRERPVSVG